MISTHGQCKKNRRQEDEYQIRFPDRELSRQSLFDYKLRVYFVSAYWSLVDKLFVSQYYGRVLEKI